MRRAGLVHDWGRLGVSNAILDKRGPLGAGEWERLRLQRYITERMLQQSEALAPLAPSALPPPLQRILAAATNLMQAGEETFEVRRIAFRDQYIVRIAGDGGCSPYG